jgi:polyhydroxybutyrate depolymerase
MKSSLILLLVPLFLFFPLTAACQPSEPSLSKAASIDVGGVRRTYRIYAPVGVGEKKQVPLVLVFHGGGGAAEQIERGTGFSELAKTDGFIVVYPQGLNRRWNDGRNTPMPEGSVSVSAEAEFVGALIREVSAKYKIDPKRIFATGISNGGFFSNYLGIKMSGTFAAIAPVVGGIGKEVAEAFAPVEPISVFVIQGTADPLVPFPGGTVARTRGEFISTEDTLRLWRKNAGTSEKASVLEVGDARPGDGCKVEGFKWSGGRKGTEVQFYKMIGGGHGWPGRGQGLPRMIVGDVCMDFDATAAVWEFFKGHPKK